MPLIRLLTGVTQRMIFFATKTANVNIVFTCLSDISLGFSVFAAKTF
jgi:hypothetical protein